MSFWFDSLFVAFLLLTLIALLRGRAATVLVVANHLTPLRTLSRIAELGQPSSQSFLPAAVFSQANLEIAGWLFTLAALLAMLFVLPASRFDNRPADASRTELPKVPSLVLLLLALYFLFSILSSRSILSSAYADPDRYLMSFSAGGLNALTSSLALYEVVRRVRMRLWRPTSGFLSLLTLFLFTDYAKGSTGQATGYLIVAAFLCFREERAAVRLRNLGLGVLTALALALAVRGMRAVLHEQGTGAVATFATALRTSEVESARTAEGIEVFGNGVQYASHVLECVTLYEAGVSREWRSIYRPVEYTFKPSFLLGALGVERSREAAWELADYYIHGGGIYVLGELYWNGGYLCVALVFAALLWFCRLCETRSQQSFAWLLILCAFAPTLLQGMGYGFAQVSRGATNGLLVLAARWFWIKVTGRGVIVATERPRPRTGPSVNPAAPGGAPAG
jgi:hypothetical protein